MKALRARARGGPEQLVVEETEQPVPREDEVLVRVHASGITPTELGWYTTWSAKNGEARRSPVVGHELSGEVVDLGAQVSTVDRGDAVYALTDFFRDGSDAEYVVVSAEVLAPKPVTLTHAQAAAVPLSALTAWQALFDHGGLARGERVLIHAAAGGVGTFAVQLARWRGAEVIGTSSASNIPFLRALGCDEVIDYRSTRFEEVVHDCDLVLDSVGGDTQVRSFRALARGGRLISIVQEPSPDQARARDVRAQFFIVQSSRDQLIEIGQLIDAGELRPIVADVLPLQRARQAFERGLAGHVRGKLVFQVTIG